MATNSALELLVRARSSLLLDQPFFGALALRLRLEENPSVAQGTAATDGKRLVYDASFIAKQSVPQLVGLVAHEIMHVALGHCWRRDERDARRWNVACDYAINGLLKEVGFQLPKGAMLSEEFDGLSAEAIYPRLRNDQVPPAPAPGGVLDGPSDSEGGAELRAQWEVAVRQAANAAKAQGNLPSCLSDLIGEALRQRVDWRALLARFVQQTARADYSWRRPNARYAALSIYTPTLRSEQMPPVVAVLDTSGSISREEAEVFVAEVAAVAAQCRPERLHVIEADAAVAHISTYEAGDQIVIREIHGGGGTDFRPAFTWVEQEGIEPACLIYLTDMMGVFPAEPPDYPVLWIATTDHVAPHGETVRMEG